MVYQAESSKFVIIKVSKDVMNLGNVALHARGSYVIVFVCFFNPSSSLEIIKSVVQCRFTVRLFEMHIHIENLVCEGKRLL